MSPVFEKELGLSVGWPPWQGPGASPIVNAPVCAAHSLMSCDSDILASVFFTLRAVRREPGLWAQHSVISFPICLKHCREKGFGWRSECVCV